MTLFFNTSNKDRNNQFSRKSYTISTLAMDRGEGKRPFYSERDFFKPLTRVREYVLSGNVFLSN